MRKLAVFLIVALGISLLSGCMQAKRIKAPYTGAKQNEHLPKGKPYKVRGETYIPYTSAHGFTEQGVASWYGPGFHGKKTSNGERYNQNAMTAAHKLLPFDTKIRVTNLDNGQSVVVRINDRGPFVGNRVIDLSRQAAKKVGMLGPGTARVRLEAISGQKPVLASDGDMLGAFYVQVGAFGSAENAARLLVRLKKMGFDGRAMRKDAYLFVQAGPFPSVRRAAEAMSRLDDIFPDVFLVAQ